MTHGVSQYFSFNDHMLCRS